MSLCFYDEYTKQPSRLQMHLTCKYSPKGLDKQLLVCETFTHCLVQRFSAGFFWHECADISEGVCLFSLIWICFKGRITNDKMISKGYFFVPNCTQGIHTISAGSFSIWALYFEV